MTKEEKLELIDLRARAKANLAMLAYLEKQSNKVSYKAKIDEMLDLINEIDKKLEGK